MIEIGIDVGGTFTDVVLLDREAGRVEVAKTASTPKDQSIGIVNGLSRLAIDAGKIDRFAHGSTVATNTVLERKGASVALLTTAGFRDLLEIGRTNRTKVYDIKLAKPAPLVARPLRFEIRQRRFVNGEAPVALHEDDVRAAALACVAAGVEAVAICFLHSYLDGADEQRAAEIVREVAPSLHVTTSADVVREYKEYERFSTTALNAYVMPVMDRYLSRLEARLAEAGCHEPIEMMKSSGGLMRASTARRYPVETLLSGPVAGVMGAIHIAERAGFPNLITYDMGGTSTDVALIADGKVTRTAETRISNLPVKTQMIDIKTVGAGGGSIASLLAGRTLKVGPHSAGADPGPACYGKGGQEPTVTDANLMLGRLSSSYALGGEIKIRPDRARAVVGEIAERLGLAPEVMADGILKLVNVTMASAIREISIQRGHDPRDFALIAFGGAGPMHACDLARDLSIPRVVVPPAPGNLCAFGLLVTDVVAERSETLLAQASTVDPADLAARFERLADTVIAELVDDGVPRDTIQIACTADMRYVGQKSELVVPVDLAQLTIDNVNEAFFRVYAERYGHERRVAPTEIVNVRVMATGAIEKADLARLSPPSANPQSDADGVLERRKVFFLQTGWVDCPVYDRYRLAAGRHVDGPAIVEELGATTVVGPTDTFTIDAQHNLVVTIGKERN
ncbi:MAG: hydantoinase/oxoprolinase family protein [Burkholderiales bacterium]|nr:hydantoinase/oxoprolinase family protein [Burkholderiales bacterium]